MNGLPVQHGPETSPTTTTTTIGPHDNDRLETRLKPQLWFFFSQFFILY
jgi:hypothetical protein